MQTDQTWCRDCANPVLCKRGLSILTDSLKLEIHRCKIPTTHRNCDKFVTSERKERGTKYDIATRAIKLMLPSLECDHLFITYLCLYMGGKSRKSDYIFKLIL